MILGILQSHITAVGEPDVHADHRDGHERCDPLHPRAQQNVHLLFEIKRIRPHHGKNQEENRRIDHQRVHIAVRRHNIYQKHGDRQQPDSDCQKDIFDNLPPARRKQRRHAQKRGKHRKQQRFPEHGDGGQPHEIFRKQLHKIPIAKLYRRSQLLRRNMSHRIHALIAHGTHIPDALKKFIRRKVHAKSGDKNGQIAQRRKKYVFPRLCLLRKRAEQNHRNQKNTDGIREIGLISSQRTGQQHDCSGMRRNAFRVLYRQIRRKNAHKIADGIKDGREHKKIHAGHGRKRHRKPSDQRGGKTVLHMKNFHQKHGRSRKKQQRKNPCQKRQRIISAENSRDDFGHQLQKPSSQLRSDAIAARRIHKLVIIVKFVGKLIQMRRKPHKNRGRKRRFLRKRNPLIQRFDTI